LRTPPKATRIIVFSDRKALLAHADLTVALPDVPEWLSPLVAVVSGQLWALELAVNRGCNPDNPRGLSKVTRTR